jgi:hypothetical protein
MASKQALHTLVDELPASSLPTAERLLESLKSGEYDPVILALLTAPIDDEAETDEERVAVEEAKADLAAGRVVTNEELRREIGW